MAWELAVISAETNLDADGSITTTFLSISSAIRDEGCGLLTPLADAPSFEGLEEIFPEFSLSMSAVVH